jgi:capsular polysaccharide biosynthesis protein
MNDFFDNQQILHVIWKRKFHIIIIGVIAVILSSVFSGPHFIRPKYRSTARIYPTNLEIFSEESESEQMLEVVNSRDIKLKMFETFQLDTVYQINREDPLFMTYMLATYNKNVSASKTKFETVEIEVMDHDPRRASDMCDSVIQFYNQKVREIHRSKYGEMVTILQERLDQKYTELDEVKNELSAFRKEYNILDYSTQVERITEGYMNALVHENTKPSHLNTIQELYGNLEEKGTDAVWLNSRQRYLISSIDTLTTYYDTYQAEYNKEIIHAHIVEHPVPADKKSYPVRWLIVTFTTMGAVFLALLVFLILDYKKKD